jgi:hypothetical protein
MTETATVMLPKQLTSMEEIQKGWNDLTLRVAQIEAEKAALEEENKQLRLLLERVIDHRQKSHNELVLILTGLVSKLPINDVAVVVSRLVEHNTNVNHVLSALHKGTTDFVMAEPVVLKNLEQTKRDLREEIKPAVAQLLSLDTPFETDMLRGLIEDPEQFFYPRFVRANRCFIKGQVPRERVVREFGEEALVFFNDMTTDPKLNPRPKPDEIVMAFKDDFEALLQQDKALPADKKKQLQALYQRVQRSKGEQARAQRNAFQKMSFFIELLHYYENQNTEAPDVIFAQRLPALVEQLVLPGTQEGLDEKLIEQAESLIGHVINPDHRLMVVNNVGKGSAAGKTLKYVLRLRTEAVPDEHLIVQEFVKHLIPSSSERPPPPEALAAILRLIHPTMQRRVIRALMSSDRLRKEQGEALAKAVGAALGLKALEAELKALEALPPEIERQQTWAKIQDLIAHRADPTSIAAAIRDRLHAKYDGDEIKASWLALVEADAISFIRVFCQLPYRADGQTDTIARPIMETYVTRLMHEKYSATYQKVLNSLRNMHKAKPDSATLLNFTALVKWVDPDAASRLAKDVGMTCA